MWCFCGICDGKLADRPVLVAQQEVETPLSWGDGIDDGTVQGVRMITFDEQTGFLAVNPTKWTVFQAAGLSEGCPKPIEGCRIGRTQQTPVLRETATCLSGPLQRRRIGVAWLLSGTVSSLRANALAVSAASGHGKRDVQEAELRFADAVSLQPHGWPATADY